MLTSGTSLGAYEVIDVLGSRGMGDVYRARDPRLGRAVAIKVLPVAFSHDADRLRRFEQEARAGAALNHPNILAVYDIGSHEQAPYIVFELRAGVTLRERLHGDALPVRKAIEPSIQIARGLAAAHEKGIVHRDLKPANLLVTHAGLVKTLDFGLAKLIEVVSDASVATREPDTKPGIVMGTVGYMAPEQMRGLQAHAPRFNPHRGEHPARGFSQSISGVQWQHKRGSQTRPPDTARRSVQRSERGHRTGGVWRVDAGFVGWPLIQGLETP